MDYLNDKQMVSAILDYLDESTYNYAILVDGAWGVGKSYFVDETLKKAIETQYENVQPQKRIVKLSLYGLSNIDKLASEIYVQIASQSGIGKVIEGATKKIAPITGAAVKIAAAIFDKSSISELSLAHIVGEMSNLDNYIFIFDDLERCSLPINDVLGYINNFVEQNSIKTILIANEDEIGTVYYQNNLELKYLLSIQADKIDFKEQTKTSHNYSCSKASNSLTDIEQIKTRIHYLFQEDEMYKQIKEKLVGRTLHYRPELKEIVLSILQKFFTTEDMQTLGFETIQDDIIQIYKESNYYNLRTLQFALGFYKRVANLMRHHSITCFSDTELIKDIYKSLLIDILKISINNKQGKKKYEWDNNNQYGRIWLEKGMPLFHKIFLSFRFTHDYVYSGIYDEDHILYILKNYYESQVKFKDNKCDPINKLNAYYLMDDSEVISRLINMKNNFFEDKYDVCDYRNILGLLVILDELGFDTELAKIHTEMKRKIQNGKSAEGLRNFYSNGPHIDNEDARIRFAELLDSLIKEEIKLNKKMKADTLNDLFICQSGWAKRFMQYYIDNDQDFLTEKAFFSKIDIAICSECIINSAIEDLNNFNAAIHKVYGFSNIYDYYKNDIPNLKAFIMEIGVIAVDGKIKGMHIRSIIEFIEETIDKLVADEKINIRACVEKSADSVTIKETAIDHPEIHQIRPTESE